MIQAGQHLTLVSKTPKHVFRSHAGSDQLYGDDLFVFLVGARSRVHASHAALADAMQKLIRTNPASHHGLARTPHGGCGNSFGRLGWSGRLWRDARRLTGLGVWFRRDGNRL